MSGEPRNLADLVSRAARAHPRKTALLHAGGRLSWAALDRRVDAVAAGFTARRLDRGDRVLLLLANSPEFVAGYFAALRAGLVAVPVNTGYTATEVRATLRDSGASLVVCDPARAAVAVSAAADCQPQPLVAVTADEGAAGAVPLAELVAAAAGRRGRPVPAGAEDLAVLLYTSGTTGRPRGAMLTHRALLANLAQLSQLQPPPVRADDVLLLVLPLFHVYSLSVGLGLLAWAGASGLLLDRFDPVQSREAIRRHRVTNLVGAPPMYLAWAALPPARGAFRSVRLAVSGAAPLPPEVLAGVRGATGLDVFEGYGLTETAPVLTSTLVGGRPKPGSVGRPIPGVQLRLLDDAGRPVEEGDPGEVTVRGANLFSGYWPDGAGGPDPDGWFATGDVAYADQDGDLHLVDRRREMIIVSGFNVYPREVEEVLLSHPDVAEAAVVGVPHPQTGESVKALVVPRPGSQPRPDELVAHAARVLARFKCPTTVELVGELPHSGLGKVAKGRLGRSADRVA